MVEQIVGNLEFLLTTPEEAALAEKQAAAQASGDVSKIDADYQNEPRDGEQCDWCAMFVPGFPPPIDKAGYCTKVKSFKGPEGMIFPDGCCKYFVPDISDLDDPIPE